jgi:hypothetical protein
MDYVLAIATLLGGFTALWFIYDKRQTILSKFHIKKAKAPTLKDLNDEEFVMLDKILSIRKMTYLVTDDSEIHLCNSLVNKGYLSYLQPKEYALTKYAKHIKTILRR